MIATFSVQNFKSIRECQTIDFRAKGKHDSDDFYTAEVTTGVRILRLCAVYGSNASGKTTLLEALDFFKKLSIARPEDVMKPLGYDKFKLDEYSRDADSQMRMEFYLSGHRYILEIRFGSDTVKYERLVYFETSRMSVLYERSHCEDGGNAKIRFGEKAGLDKIERMAIKGNTMKNSTVLSSVGVSNIASASPLCSVFAFMRMGVCSLLYPRNGMTAYTHARLREDKDGTLKRFLLRFLQASDFNISSISLKETDFMATDEAAGKALPQSLYSSSGTTFTNSNGFTVSKLLFTHKTRSGVYELDESAESSGTMRYLGVAALLFRLTEQASVVMIDEIETSIHYELLVFLIKTFLLSDMSCNSQLLFTTHDVNLLNEDILRNDATWFTDKNSDGATLLRRLSDFSLHKNISPYNAYRQGKIVDLPFTMPVTFHEDEK